MLDDIFVENWYTYTREQKFAHTSYGLLIRRHQIFLGGSSDENEKVLGKFLARLRRAKKGVPKFFACAGLFFVMEALKTAKNR